MPEVEIEIGERVFTVACQAGEEPHLQSAAKLLDAEASHLIAAAGRLPEAKMLLMAGLMLADKMDGMKANASAGAADTSELEARLAQAAARVASLEAELAERPDVEETAVVNGALVRLVEDAEALAAELENG